MDELYVGMMVASYEDPDIPGAVTRLDYEGNIAYVSFSTRDGHDIVDIDPGDLVAYEMEKSE